MLIKDLELIEPIKKALRKEGYTEATPIQEQSIPSLLKGLDLLGCAQTGTGKTAAFATPILQALSLNKTRQDGKRQIKALILAPTRELAIQISDSFKAYGSNLPLKTLVIYGGVSQHPQTKELIKGVDILVATPGRLLDLIGQKFVSLKNVEHFVLDEADMMLDMGMLQDVRRIIKYIPVERQTMCFSATMPSEIEKLSASILRNPIKVAVTPVASTVDIIEQALYYVDKGNKKNLLIELLKDESIESALVFSRTKHGANKIVSELEKKGFSAEAIHGNKSQNARQKALKNFKEKKTRILVATDIAARGIDIDQLSHVINFDLPEVPETYVHRIGRTGRAGLGGVAISFCCFDEKPFIKGIEKLISKDIPVVEEHDFPLKDTFSAPKKERGRRPQSNKSSSYNSQEDKTKPKRTERKSNNSRKYGNRKNK
ncbi:MAG: DEAD/DEAH box helicase [Gudongella sp.]|nr:DEAD/DEAH box helicase [Gudongella sp.]